MQQSGSSLCHHLDEMLVQLIKMGPIMVNQRSPISLHDNSRLHVAKITLQKLSNLGNEILPHLPYSSDLSPPANIFQDTRHFSAKKKIHSKGKRKICI